MKFWRWQSYCYFLLCYLIFIIVGCAAPKMYLAHPEFEIKRGKIKTVLLVPPDIKIYERSIGLRDDWSKTGRENIQQALVQGFKEKSIELKELTIDEVIKEEVEDIQALYKVIILSLYKDTPVGGVPNKKLDYSIGSVEGILKESGADALLLVWGYDEIATTKEKTLNWGVTILGAMGGVGTISFIITPLNVAVVDTSGTILWQKRLGISKDTLGIGGYDLRNPKDATAIVRWLLSDFQLGK